MPRDPTLPVRNAFDELRFGPARTLNLRASLPTATEACHRTEQWLRAKQVERAGDVLIITGRGNNSLGGISVVRQAVLAFFPSLRRRNVITGWTQHTAGSFVVVLAPVAALFEVPRRRRERRPTLPKTIPELAALSEETVTLLRELAMESLTLLGVQDVQRFLKSEMLTKFTALSAVLPDTNDRDAALRGAIRHALDELDDR